MNLTKEQAAAARCPSSVAVTAGAGTGKTHMLAERYLYHIQQQLSPLAIVAVTFTDQAAAELRSRIRRLVAERLPGETELLAELEAAQISTLHALSARICRQHPEAARVPPGFQILDELEGRLWVPERLEEVLAELPAEFYEQVPYSLMHSVLGAFLQDPLPAQRALEVGPERWSALVQAERERALGALLTHPTWHQASQTLRAVAAVRDDRLEEVRQTALQHLVALANGGEPQEHLPALAELKINVGSQKNWPPGGLSQGKEAIKELRALVQDALDQGLVTLEVGPADEQLAEIQPVLKQAFQQARERLARAKHQARVLDFGDLEVCALRALEHQAVRAYYQERWQAFLVDEFQDINPVQAELLERLTERALLTIVGDEKQSIYGFRRAEVAVFRRFRGQICSGGGQEVSLVTSFRTHAGLLAVVNSVFRLLLPERYQDLEAYRLELPHPGPHLRVYVVQASREVHKLQRQRAEAQQIARRLREMLDTGVLVHGKARDTLRPVCPGDVAVLSRTWEPLELYGEALEAWGIPTVHAGGGNLLETREAKDAWALLRFLDDPADDLALAAVLRSPCFAVSDQVLFTFAQRLPEKVSWWSGLQGADLPELARPRKVLSELLAASRAELPSRLLQLADRLTGYSAVIANLPGAARREADWRGFRELVQQLERGAAELFVLVRRLKRLWEAEVEVSRPPLEAGNAVALMTVHAAKGLEWPVVVVPDLTRQAPRSLPLAHFDPELGVALRLGRETGDPALYTVLQRRAEEKEKAEARRVLYVALTRARDHLILTAAGEEGGGLEILRPGLEAAGIPIEVIPFAPGQAVPLSRPEPELPQLPPRFLTASLGSGLFELPATALGEYAQCPKRFGYHFLDGHPGLGEGEAIARRVGALVHWALEHGVEDLKALTRLDPTLLVERRQEALLLARRFRQLPLYGPFRQRAEAREQRVTLKIKQLVLHGVVDLVGPDFVLDFKTDREVRPEHHRFQLWAYAQATGRPTAHIAYLRHDQLYSFDQGQLEATRQLAHGLVEALLDGPYPARPSPENCAYCPYAEICAERYQGSTSEDKQ